MTVARHDEGLCSAALGVGGAGVETIRVAQLLDQAYERVVAAARAAIGQLESLRGGW